VILANRIPRQFQRRNTLYLRDWFEVNCRLVEYILPKSELFGDDVRDSPDKLRRDPGIGILLRVEGIK
jgi:hypothetical protein